MTRVKTGPLASRAWILLPAVVLTALDGVLTLYGQPLAYWAGDFSAAHEYSPLGAAFLNLHPSAFGGLMLSWILVIVVVGLLLSPPWDRVWTLMIVIGHATGSFDWLEDFSYFGALPFFLLAALLTVLSWRKADSIAARSPTVPGDSESHSEAGA